MDRVLEQSVFVKVKDSRCPTTVAVAQWLERYVNESCKHKLGNVTNPPIVRLTPAVSIVRLTPAVSLW